MRFLIIGDGVAGHTAAVELRERRPEAEIIIISDEQYPFYDRVALKRVVAGKAKRAEMIKADQDFYRSHDIELMLESRVVEVNPEQKQVVVSRERKQRKEKGTIDYDRLLIAAGGHLKRLDIEHADNDNVFYPWNLEDAHQLDQYCDRNDVNSAVVIGGGFLGLETACSLHKRGLNINYLVRESRWGQHCVSKDVAEIMHDHLEKEGIDFELEVEAHDFKADETHNLVQEVEANGTTFDCDLVAVCIGLERNLNFLEGSGIETNNGVITDRYLQTNYEHVYAAGDIAEYQDVYLNKKMVNGSWPSARKQGRAAALNMLGKEQPLKFVNAHVVSYFDFDLMTLGDIWLTNSKESEVRTYEKNDKQCCTQILVRDDQIVGAVLLNDLCLTAKVKDMIKQGASFSENRAKLGF